VLRVYGRVWDSGSWIEDLGFRMKGLRVGVLALGSCIEGPGVRI